METAHTELDLRRLVEQYGGLYPKVYNYARFLLKDPVAADEVTADTFTRAFDKIGFFDASRGTMSAWIMAIARTTAIDHLRRIRRSRRLFSPIRDDVPDPASRPEYDAIAHETRNELLEALSRLSVREREVVSLKFSARLTNREVAAILGWSEGNVGVTVFRAVRRLRRLLEKTG